MKDISEILKYIGKIPQSLNTKAEKEELNELQQDIPIIEIITPEWFYSDCHKLPIDESLTWENLDTLEITSEACRSILVKENRYSHMKTTFEKNFCCWYQSYHYTPQEKWGIHLRYDCIVSMGNKLMPQSIRTKMKLKDTRYTKSAMLYFYIHCLFHHLFENIVTSIEILTADPYLYMNYVKSIYCETFNSRFCLEEALANSFLLLLAEDTRISKKHLEKILRSQGEGYNEFSNFVDNKFLPGVQELLLKFNYDKEKVSKNLLHNLIEYSLSDHSVAKKSMVPIWIHKSPLPAT